jgi:ADP-ribosylglycohydrolase
MSTQSTQQERNQNIRILIQRYRLFLFLLQYIHKKIIKYFDYFLLHSIQEKMSSENRYDRFIGVLVCGAVGSTLGFINKGKSFDEIKKENILPCTYFNYIHGSNIELMIVLGRYLVSINKHTSTQPTAQSQNMVVQDHIDMCTETIKWVHMLYKNVIKKSTKIYSKETIEILINWESNSTFGTLNNCDAAVRIAPLALTPLKPDKLLYAEIINLVYFTHGGCKDSIDIAFVHVKLLHSLLFGKRKTAEEIYPYMLYLAQLCKNKQLYISMLALNPNNKQIFVNNQWNITHSLYGFDFFQQSSIDCYVCALTCFLYNFNNPIKAMSVAMTIGGDTENITKLTGDMIGAVHGVNWLPLEWTKVENKEILSTIATRLYCCFPKESHGWTFEHSTNITS